MDNGNSNEDKPLITPKQVNSCEEESKKSVPVVQSARGEKSAVVNKKEYFTTKQCGKDSKLKKQSAQTKVLGKF